MENNKKNDPKSLAMVITSMLIFGSIGVFRRYIPLSSTFLAFSRGILGGLFILVFMKMSGRMSGQMPGTTSDEMSGKSTDGNSGDVSGSGVRGKLRASHFLWLALVGAVMGVNWILLFEAYNHTTVAVATLCYYMEPTIVVLLSPFIFKERLTGRKAVCAGVAILGMVLVSGVLGGTDSGTGDIRGVLFGLSAAALYAAVVIMNKMISGIDAYQRTTVQLLAAGIVMVPYLLLTGGFGGGDFTVRAIVLLLVVGIVHTGIAYLLYFGGMDGIRVQSIAILSYVDPVSALFFSAVFLGEPLSLLGIIGAVMIIGSAIISEM